MIGIRPPLKPQRARSRWICVAAFSSLLWAFAWSHTAGEEDVAFSDYFTSGALRIDLVHSGTRTSETVSLRTVKRARFWAGPKETLVPPWSRGNYRFDVLDGGSGKLIYSKGLSTLFGEWRTTDEALRIRRAFEETLEMPYPKDSVEVVLLRRNVQATFDSIFAVAIDPHAHWIDEVHVNQRASVYDLQINGAPEQKVDLLILGDGYQQGSGREKFERDCERMLNDFFSAEPFESYRNRFNVRAVFLASDSSGIDAPREGIYRSTALGMKFDTFDIARYCTTENIWAVYDLASLAPHDAILLMANSSRYGGGGIYNFYTAFVSDNEYSGFLLTHEFGHGFAGLADEYYASAVAYNEFYPPGIEPWEPNITALLDPARLKWADLVERGTPIPTPPDDERYRDKVGAFEGAGYAAKGLYRPTHHCRMFSKDHKAFCPVCQQALIELIRFYAPD